MAGLNGDVPEVGWMARGPLLWCLHAVSVARDNNPFVLFAGDVKRKAEGRIGRGSQVRVIALALGLTPSRKSAAG